MTGQSHQHWSTVQAILRTYHRRAELRALVRWATWKQLDGPLRAYQYYLAQTEARLAHNHLRFPRHHQLARLLYWVHRLVRSRPHYYPRGSAAHYRRQRYRRDPRHAYPRTYTVYRREVKRNE